MKNNNLCLNCKRELLEYGYHFSNICALRHGYCCFACMMARLGKEEAYLMLDDEMEESRRRL